MWKLILIWSHCKHLYFLEFRRIFAKAAILTLSSPDYFWVPGPGGGGGGGRKVLAAHNTETIHGIEVKIGRVVENHKLINLVYFN